MPQASHAEAWSLFLANMLLVATVSDRMLSLRYCNDSGMHALLFEGYRGLDAESAHYIVGFNHTHRPANKGICTNADAG